ncbi:MAG: DUF6807 family protein [Coraliomargaritaceae bacterium]
MDTVKSQLFVNFRLIISALTCLCGSVAGDSHEELVQKGNATSFQSDGTVLWTYHHDSAQGKPYLHPLADTSGEVYTDLRPSDHPWHRGLWFSWKTINGVNYWEEDQTTGLSDGWTKLLSTECRVSEENTAHFFQDLAYAPSQKANPVLTEKRSIRISAPDADGTYMIDWDSTFLAVDGEVSLSRTPVVGEENGKTYGGYAGLSLRMNKEMRTGEFLNANKAIGREGHATPSPWSLFNKKAGGSLLFMDHPENRRHPNKWYLSTGMPYVSPAVLFDSSLTLGAKETLRLRYRIRVSPKSLRPEQADSIWAAWTKKKPNILFISIDDMRPQTAAYGHSIMVTPNLDQLAAEGRLFNRHYAQVATCGPSRGCLLSGKNLTQKSDINHGHFGRTLRAKPESDQPETFIHHFKQNGYYTVGMGKISHSGSGGFYNKETKKFTLELPYSWNEYMGDEGSRWGPQPLVHAYAFGKTRETHDLPPYECAKVADEDYPDGRLADRAVRKLDQLAKQEQPFFLAVGFYKPHLPFAAPKKYWDFYQANEIPISPNPDLPEAVSPVFLHSSNEFFGQYRGGWERGGAGKRLSDNYAREVIHGHFASISYMDAQLGKVLAKLKSTGLDQNTIVVVWGDHGWHLGDHTIWGKHSSFERALKSILLVKTPEQKRPGTATNALVASIDLYPTLCELTGLPKPSGLEGKSFLSAILNPNAPGKDTVISYWRDILSVRTEQYRMALFNNGKRQEVMLFDHQADPHETTNIAKQNPELVQKLTQILQKENRGYLPQIH